MGERHVLVLPRPVRVHFQFTGAQQYLGGLTTDGVAVGVHLIGEGVELALALQAIEGALHDQRVQDPDVADSSPVGAQVGCVDPVVEVGELHDGDRVEAERHPGGFDVPGYVRRLLLGLRRLHPQTLDDRRIDAAHHQCHERPQADSKSGQHPAPPPDVHQQQHNGEQRDEDQEVYDRELRIHVGVGGSYDGAPVRCGQLESCKPVVAGPHEGDQAEQDRKVDLDLRLDPFANRLESDTTVDVVEDRGEDQDHHQRGEQPADHEAHERQAEDVEAKVPTELCI